MTCGRRPRYLTVPAELCITSQCSPQLARVTSSDLWSPDHGTWPYRPVVYHLTVFAAAAPAAIRPEQPALTCGRPTTVPDRPGPIVYRLIVFAAAGPGGQPPRATSNDLWSPEHGT